MDTTKAMKIALDDALVAPRLKIRKCNHRLSSDLKYNEPTIQVVLDALKLTPIYKAFEITASVPEIYMQEFWATVSIHHKSLRFKMNDKSHTLNLENFRDMLQICPRLPGQKFEDPPLEEEILSFIRDLGHTREIRFITDVNVNHLHQPWRSFAAIINRCLSGKTTGLDSIRLSRAQIIWGMYYEKNVDYVNLLWEDLDLSISRRNKMFWHTVRDEPMFNMIRVISRYQDIQIYGAILPDELTNQEMLDSKAYKEYYAVASGAEPLKAKTKYKKKADEPVIPSKSKSASVAKGKRLKSPAKVTQSGKKKQPASVPKAKGLKVLSEVAVFEDKQMKIAMKISKTQFHSSHASGSGDEVDTQSKEDTNKESDVNDDSEETESNIETSSSDTTIPPPPIPIIQPLQQTPESTTTITIPTTTLPDIPNFASLFQFDHRVSVLETEMSKFKQTNQFVEAISSILGIVDTYLASKMKEVVDVAIQL
ncbi:hypothetical protein Tco_0836038 [Tanacetum coccineum]